MSDTNNEAKRPYKRRKKPVGDEKKVFSVRTRPSVMNALKGIAKEDDRSTNYLIEKVLNEYIKSKQS